MIQLKSDKTWSQLYSFELISFGRQMASFTDNSVANFFFHSPWRLKWSQLGALKQDTAFRVCFFAARKNRPSSNKKLPTPSLIPLRCYDGLKALHTLWRQLYWLILHILTPLRMSHILAWIGQPTFKLEKKFVRASSKPRLKNYESVQHRLQFSGIIS